MILQPCLDLTVTATRYALYLVPRRDSLLWESACRWLGRDPETGSLLSQPPVPGYEAQRIRELTHSPRQYGFHATLKAPFKLAGGADEGQLMTQVAQLADTLPGFFLPALQVDKIGAFLALCPDGADARLPSLAQRGVTALDPLRAPLETTERARRHAAGLTAHQKELLERWGYPFVLDEYRFHMTLTQQLDDDDAELLRRWLQDWFAGALAADTNQAELAVFRQAHPEADFFLLRRFRLMHA
jgi:putative phosphonate metabolism protein